MMLALIWATLLLSVSGRTATRDRREAPVKNNPNCDEDKPCNILSEANITAEAGLCVVIPCSFTAEDGFDVKNITWYKCDEKGDKPIYNSKNIRPEYEGRVSLLESDFRKGNCSIIINDLTSLDSGSYYIRANGSKKKADCKNSVKATITVTALSQKPNMMIPPLTEGQQTTLTCTAPGLCSGSRPTITWKWRGAGGKDSDITGNVTAFQTERYSSTLTFTPSAEHHGTNITCKVNFTGGSATEETQTLTFNSIATAPETHQNDGDDDGEAKKNVTNTKNEPEEKGLLADVLDVVLQLHGITVFLVGFVMGMLLSAIIACLVVKCCRKKQKRSKYLDDNVELVVAQAAPLMDDGPAAEHDRIHVQDAAEGGAESSGLDGDLRPKEVEYSDLDFSAMKRRNPTGAEETQDAADTEYAEIKKEAREERPGGGGENGDVVEGSWEEEEEVVVMMMMGEDEEAQQGMNAEEEGGGENAF
ncbi:uncharacterized protein LOC103363694 [Stegastes partitus]|uniref:Uncharacterized LOC103363694 n=1 Tax=Stegastes partitus TaxID=144197 RepID=A0A3B5ARX0_9TELE|nr:PREDICTED: uncharacterized protein LOC103363694 [Stegastes partitus]